MKKQVDEQYCKKIVDKVYPIIAKDYNSNAKVELYSDIFTSKKIYTRKKKHKLNTNKDG